MRTTLERTETRFGIKLRILGRRQRLRLGGQPCLAGQEEGNRPHIPVFDKSNRTDGTFSRVDFKFDPDQDRYTCPGQGTGSIPAHLRTSQSGITAAGTRIYRASKLDCGVCELKAQCCPNDVARKIPRDLHEDARDAAWRARRNSGIRGGLSPAEESRDAVRTSQADTPPSITRVCASGVQTEPTTNSSSRLLPKI